MPDRTETCKSIQNKPAEAVSLHVYRNDLAVNNFCKNTHTHNGQLCI